MAEDKFFKVMDWFEQNKHRLPIELHPIFEDSHMKFVFKWKEAEPRLVQAIREYLTHFNPFMKQADKATNEEIDKAITLTVFDLCERMWKTMADCFERRTVEQVYKDHVQIMDQMIADFKFSNLEHQLSLTPEYMLEPRFNHLIEERKEELREIAEEGIATNKHFIDTVQPIILEVFPNLMDLEGDWWKVYEYHYVACYNDIYDGMNSIEHKFEKQQEAK